MPPQIIGAVDMSSIIADAERPILNREWQEEPPGEETMNGEILVDVFCVGGPLDGLERQVNAFGDPDRILLGVSSEDRPSPFTVGQEKFAWYCINWQMRRATYDGMAP